MLSLLCKQQLTSKTMCQQSRAPAVHDLTVASCVLCVTYSTGTIMSRHNCINTIVSIVQLYEAFTWIASGFCHLLFGTVSILELGLAQVSKDGFADHGKYILQSYLFQVSREEEIS